MPEQGMGSQIFSSILFFLLTPFSNWADHVPPGKIHSSACGITDNLKELCQHLWHHNDLPSNHTLSNVFCSVPQNKMYESINVGRVISQSADNLPDSASCILKSSHTEESQGTQPRQPGGGDSSSPDHRWKGMMLSSAATAPLGQRTGSAGQAAESQGHCSHSSSCNPASSLPSMCWNFHFLFENPTSPCLVPCHEHARQTYRDHGGLRGTDWPALLYSKGIKIFSTEHFYSKYIPKYFLCYTNCSI